MSSLRKELKQTRSFDSLEQETFLNLQRTAGCLAGPMEHLLKDYSLGPSLYNVLRILRGQQGQGMACTLIGERMVNRVPDVTRLVDKLVRLGLVHRERASDDRRLVLVAITERGLAALGHLDAPLTAVHRRSFTQLTERELKTLNRLLVKARAPHKGDQ